MRGSAKGREPEELLGWKEAQRVGGIDLEYRNLPPPEKRATVKVLFAEQTGQCVYCGRRISLYRHGQFPHRALQAPIQVSRAATRLRESLSELRART